MDLLKLIMKYIIQITVLTLILLTIVLLITTRKLKAESLDVFLVTPKKEIQSDFQTALIIPNFPTKAVCLSPTEYKRMRSADLVCSQLDTSEYYQKYETAPKQEQAWKDYLGAFILGVLAGYVGHDLSQK